MHSERGDARAARGRRNRPRRIGPIARDAAFRARSAARSVVFAGALLAAGAVPPELDASDEASAPIVVHADAWQPQDVPEAMSPAARLLRWEGIEPRPNDAVRRHPRAQDRRRAVPDSGRVSGGGRCRRARDAPAARGRHSHSGAGTARHHVAPARRPRHARHAAYRTYAVRRPQRGARRAGGRGVSVVRGGSVLLRPSLRRVFRDLLLLVDR